MKKLILTMLAGATMLVSCADFIDLVPENNVTYTNGMGTPNDMESILTNAQATFQGALTPLKLQELAGAYANGCQDGGMMAGGKEARNHLWYSSMMDIGFWSDYYKVIGLSNIILANVKKSWSQEHRDYFNGQAHFLKAMCYYDLGRRWGWAPIVPDNDYEAPPVGVSKTSDLLEKSIVEAKKAFSELSRYKDMRYSDGNKMDNKQYANKEIAAALLANIYAWMANVTEGISPSDRTTYLTESEKYATMLIDGDLRDYASLEPSISSLKENTLNSRHGVESIFELEYNTKYTIFMQNTEFYVANKFFGYPYKHGVFEGEAPPYSISCKLILDLYGENSADERKMEYFDLEQYDKTVTDLSWPDTPARVELVEVFPGFWMTQIIGGSPNEAPNRAYVKKFYKQSIGKTSPTEPERFFNFDCNKIIWRLADIILLRAETRNFLGNEGGAQTDLNVIRSRAKADLYPAASDTEGLQKAIFREREKELIYENHRFFDVMRNKDYYKTELTANLRKLTKQDILEGAFYLPEPRDANENNSKFTPNVYWYNHRN